MIMRYPHYRLMNSVNGLNAVGLQLCSPTDILGGYVDNITAMIQFTRKNQPEQRIAIDVRHIIAVEESSHDTIVTTKNTNWYVEEGFDVVMGGWQQVLDYIAGGI